MPRSDYVHELCNLAGPTVAQVIDAKDGWPGLIRIKLSTGWVQASLHVDPVHSMARKPHEFRFQNPASKKPVSTLPGTIPLLIGIWNRDTPPVLVAAEPAIRMGRRKRFSVLFPARLFREAQRAGWAEPYRNNKGQLHWSFLPQLLPVFVEIQQGQLVIPAHDLQTALAATGVTESPTQQASARARRATTRLVRDASFGKRVVEAYGFKCAMCGLNLGLVAGAHIMPVSDPNSTDQTTNGLALCENHHRAFDRHRIWVHPQDRTLAFHPEVLTHAASSPVSRAFVDSTFAQLVAPQDPTLAPLQECFEARYAYYDGEYSWAS